MNHFGMRGGHFNSILKEFATTLVTRPSLGFSFRVGPFALSLNGALGKILHTWGSVLTWTAQRQRAAQIVCGMDSYFANSSFMVSMVQTSLTTEQYPFPTPPVIPH